MRPKIHRSRARHENQRGNALIEFGICSVVMMLITIGVTDFARMFAVADVTAGAASAGAQYGALSPAHWSDYVGIQNAALNDAGSTTGITVTASNTCYCVLGGVSVTCPADCSAGGSAMEYVTVSVTGTVTNTFNYPWMPHIPSITAVNSVRVQ